MLLERGEFLSFGYGMHSFLGHVDRGNRLTQKAVVEALQGRQVTQVSAGDSQSLVLLKCAEVLLFGRGQGERLAHGDQQGQLVSKVID